MKSLTAAVFTMGLAAVPAQTPQAPPRTEVYLASFTSGPAGTVSGPLINVSQSPGYDNQPSYTPDGQAILFTSDRVDRQTDIFRYNLASKSLTRLTHDPANEYSPLVMPGGGAFSVVHGDEQSLWSFDLDGSHGHLLYQHKGKIGYHVWIDPSHVGIFVLGDQGQPATLQIANVKTNETTVIASSIGRSLSMRPGTGKMTFVDKSKQGHWSIKELDPKTRAITTLVESPEGSEDYAWDPATGQVVMASGTQILGWSPSRAAQGWRPLGDLSTEGVTSITRLAVNPVASAPAVGRLALVAVPK
jgi:Tol biopolymer transport system component